MTTNRHGLTGVSLKDVPLPTDDEWKEIVSNVVEVEAMPPRKGPRDQGFMQHLEPFVDGKVYFIPHEDLAVLARIERSLRHLAYSRNFGFTARLQRGEGGRTQGLYVQALPDQPRNRRVSEEDQFRNTQEG